MTRRLAISLVLLVVGLAAVAAWGISYWRWPVAGFPWPTSGLGQQHDRGFLLLADGRLFVIRQRADVAPVGPRQPPTAPQVEIPETAVPRGLSADTTVLGSMTVWGAHAPRDEQRRPMAMIAVGSVEDALAGRPWNRLGFTGEVLSAPRVMVDDAVVTARITATGVPLWPFALALLPAAWLLFRGRRSRRWAAEGRCGACGYDLRESPDRCPECGKPTGPARSTTVAQGAGT